MKKFFYLTYLVFMFSLNLFSQHFENDSILQKQAKPFLDKQIIKLLPVQNQNQLNLLFPGITNYNAEKLSIYGLVVNEQHYLIDGIPVKNLNSFPVIGIEKFSINNSNPIEQANSLSGFANISTQMKFEKPSFNLQVSGMANGYSSINLKRHELLQPKLEFAAGIPLKLLKTKGKKTAGIFIAGIYKKNKSAYFGFNDAFQIEENKLDSLQQFPLIPSPSLQISTQKANYLLPGDLVKSDNYKSSNNSNISLYTKIALPISDKLQLDLGNFTNIDQGQLFVYENSLMNSENNPEYMKQNINSYITLNYNILNGGKLNISVNANINYSHNYYKQQSAQHKDQFFDYGYAGKFDRYNTKYYVPGIDTIAQNQGLPYIGFLHYGFVDTLVEYEPATINPEIAAYSSYYYQLYESNELGPFADFNQIKIGGGLLNGQKPPMIYQMWNAPGTVSDYYGIHKNEELETRINFIFEFENHRITLGGGFIQQKKAKFEIKPRDLWTLSRELVNNQIENLDRANPHPVYDNNGVFQGLIEYDRLFQEELQSLFDIQLREQLNLAKDGFDLINIDAINPSNLSLSLYSADDLFNQGNSLINYYGFDHTGSLFTNSASLQDFLSKTNEQGFYERKKPAFQPKQLSFYINDYFTSKWLTVSFGMRTEKYNANQNVLKDPYLMAEAIQASEVTEFGEHPENIEANYIVYVDDFKNPENIVGYRNKNDWFFADGSKINNVETLFDKNGQISPLLKNDSLLNINSFSEYKPILSFLPQIEIYSAPIYGFNYFLKYNTATQTPVDINIIHPEDYLYIRNINRTLTNPNLKPVKISKFEFGISYLFPFEIQGEIKYFNLFIENPIIVKEYVGAFPVSYSSYENSSENLSNHGMAIKLMYNPQQFKNLFFQISYTRQLFNKEDAISNIKNKDVLIQNENYIHAPDFMLNNFAVFSLGSGHNYLGPNHKISEKVLQNVSIGISHHFKPGLHYTKTDPKTNERQGDLYEYNLPSYHNIDVKINKVISTKNSVINTFLTIENVINRENLYSIYSATGNSYDSGFLSANVNQDFIENQQNAESYRLLRSIYENNPKHYAKPRLFRFGISFSF